MEVGSSFPADAQTSEAVQPREAPFYDPAVGAQSGAVQGAASGDRGHDAAGSDLNVQVTARPDGTPLWSSRATPGRTHDLTAARSHGIVQACLTRQILVLADRAYQGAGATSAPNRDHARLRAPGERAFAQLKSWRLLRRARCSTRRISTIVQAVHTLLTCCYSG